MNLHKPRNTQCLTIYADGQRCPYPCKPIGRCASCLDWYSENDPLNGRPWALRSIGVLKGGCKVQFLDDEYCGARTPLTDRWMCTYHRAQFNNGSELTSRTDLVPGRKPKLSQEQIIEMVALRLSDPKGVGHASRLAEKYGVSVKTVYNYLRGAST